MKFEFIDGHGTFRVHNPQKTSFLYMPVASRSGVMGDISPDGHGDLKLSQNRYLLPPVVIEDLQESMYSRNFWVDIEGSDRPLSALGFSASQMAEGYESELEAGMLWQKLTVRVNEAVEAQTLVFAPDGEQKAEIMQVTLVNRSDKDISLTPVAAIPVFARGADHIRDHRHVTSLLNVIKVEDDGVTVKPTMAFDERGHHRNSDTYGVHGIDPMGKVAAVYPTVMSFTGEGASLIAPKSVFEEGTGVSTGSEITGEEAFAGLKFEKTVLKAGQSLTYTVVMSFDGEGLEYLDSAKVKSAFEATVDYWNSEKVITTSTGDPVFDGWMEWVSVQPALRKIYGCSFLPYHDYGRGGRGWRDLWQDSLALLMRSPAQARDDLAGYFAGIRTDGSNATIIGSSKGEFIADRNGIVRVWMDHGFWPMFTVQMYINQTGDYDFLFEKNTYFKDRQILRGQDVDEDFPVDARPVELDANGNVYEGTLLEHLLIQQLTQFFDCGEHGNMRLRGADWNDAFDMAASKGESVAFTAAYAGSIEILAQMIRLCDRKEIEVLSELKTLIYAPDCEQPERRAHILEEYEMSCAKNVSGTRISIDAGELAQILERRAMMIKDHLRRNEFVSDDLGNSWYNGYYDNDSAKVEGVHDGSVRMMLTSQVFTVMFGIATEDQVGKIIKSADRYLFDPECGGYRLNTNFNEVKMNMGRAFGFGYGQKENGAVFCHMAVMYSYALYKRGFAAEGYKVFDALYRQSVGDKGRMYPGIPEYFGPDGRGMYPYLTGAASWAVMLVLNEMFGVTGRGGRLTLMPKLLAGQFGADGRASVMLYRDGLPLKVVYINESHADYGSYRIGNVRINGRVFDCDADEFEIPQEAMECNPGCVEVTLVPR
ncbi:MAG: cellobiose phosphorylase [Saccharofermentans sp.]|jgi:cellobiose phosphorylase|nr:cellobiose phosphorylase [Mageeibacillus sp.]MCI1263788.1 cellobiose phosphorylase [Saccharofermentans sp.]MCI1274745.1 cellobiose phosphorylase [Saccharofermentans sp.]MCI1769171.1 cellobiose phosphorylase [Mageeibacillus sp.]MCI2044715.1 cellobiose phosphorylase [Mageeibacillus sp.]